MPDEEKQEDKPDLSTLSNVEFEHKKNEFLSYQRQVAKAAAEERAKVHRDSIKPEDLSAMNPAEFEKATRRMLKGA